LLPRPTGCSKGLAQSDQCRTGLRRCGPGRSSRLAGPLPRPPRVYSEFFRVYAGGRHHKSRLANWGVLPPAIRVMQSAGQPRTRTSDATRVGPLAQHLSNGSYLEWYFPVWASESQGGNNPQGSPSPAVTSGWHGSGRALQSITVTFNFGLCCQRCFRDAGSEGRKCAASHPSNS
jgi:hypothetical protein